MAAVLAAVICSVSTQYGVKFLVDSLAGPRDGGNTVWTAFAVLVLLIGADNLLWRVASVTASYSFVAVTSDLDRSQREFPCSKAARMFWVIASASL